MLVAGAPLARVSVTATWRVYFACGHAIIAEAKTAFIHTAQHCALLRPPHTLARSQTLRAVPLGDIKPRNELAECLAVATAANMAAAIVAVTVSATVATIVQPVGRQSQLDTTCWERHLVKVYRQSQLHSPMLQLLLPQPQRKLQPTCIAPGDSRTCGS